MPSSNSKWPRAHVKPSVTSMTSLSASSNYLHVGVPRAALRAPALSASTRKTLAKAVRKRRRRWAPTTAATATGISDVLRPRTNITCKPLANRMLTVVLLKWTRNLSHRTWYAAATFHRELRHPISRHSIQVAT